MKSRFIALFLALTISGWAQTANSTHPPATEKNAPAADSKGTCCEKMASHAKADSSEHAQHCMHASAVSKDGKDAASCCSGKDTTSCCSGKDGEACAKNESGSADCCGEKSKAGHEMGYCSENAGKRTAKRCCVSGQCTHEHHEQSPVGN